MTPSAVGALLRLARRNVRRSLWRSALIVVLIALPVAGMVGAAALADAAQPTAEEAATNAMGRADLLVSPADPLAADADRLRDLLPAGSRVEAILQSADELLVDGLRVSVGLRGEDLEGLAAGRLTIVEGRAPAATDEAAVTAAAADMTGVGIGDRLELGNRGSLDVVGIVANPERADDRLVLVAPPSVTGDVSDVAYLVELPRGAVIDPGDPSIAVDRWEEGAAFNATSRAAVMPFGQTTRLALIVVGGLALVEAALVAAAAFAVGLRRRLREFGLLGAAGAGPGHLAGAVVAEGVVLGLAGVAIGMATGVIGLLAAGPLLPGVTNRMNAVARFDPGWLVLCAVIGLLAALAAAAWPALTASRISVLAALSGRRPPSRPATHGLAVGIGLLVIGGSVTLAAAMLQRADGSDLSIYLLLVGAVLGVLGCGAMSPWFVERISHLAPRLPLSPRIALRDAGRSRNRSGPIVTAVLASLAATVALATLVASQEASMQEQMTPELGERHLLIGGPGAELAGARIAEELEVVGGAPMHPAVRSDGFWLSVTADATLDGAPLEAWNIAVGDWALAEALEVPESYADAFAAGTVLFFTTHDLDVSRATVNLWGEDGLVEARELAGRHVAVDTRYPALPDAIMHSTVAAELGIVEVDVAQYLVTLASVPDGDAVATAANIAGAYPDTFVQAQQPIGGGQDTLRFVILAASVLVALTVTGVAVALGEAEARADHRTLVTVGAHPSLRRRITAARAGTVAAVGGVLAVPAGLLPVWGVLLARDMAIVIPAPEILIAVVGLPVLAVLGGLLFSPNLPAYAERRAA